MGNSRKLEKTDATVALLKLLQQVLQPLLPKNAHLCLGFSGGLDSTVLLHLLHQLSRPLSFRLSAMHVNHHLQPEAPHWQQFCETQCKMLGVHFVAVDVFVRPQAGESLENLARIARYRAFAGQSCDFIVLAHHQRDQAETLLIQLLRGAGVAGLSAMATLRTLARNSSGAALLRPLLQAPQAQLKNCALQRGLRWIEDPSNDSTQHVRNFLRHQVAPMLEQRFPSWASSLARSAAHLAQAGDLLEELAQQDLRACAGPWGLVIERVMALGHARATNLMRAWFRLMGVPPCHAAQLHTWFQQAHAGPGRLPMLRWGQWVLVRHLDQWMLHPALDAAWSAQHFDRWSSGFPLALPGAGQLHQRFSRSAAVLDEEATLARQRGPDAASRAGGEFNPHFLSHALRQGVLPPVPWGQERLTRLRLEILDQGPWVVRRRQGQESMRLYTGGPTRTLRNLLQEAGLPVWWRNSAPLLFCGEQLVCVPGLVVAASHRAAPDQPGVELFWQPPADQRPEAHGNDARPCPGVEK